MSTIQLTLDEHLLTELNSAGKPLGLEPAELIKATLRAWLKHRQSARFEQDWIAALQRQPDEAGDAEAWLDAQVWSES